MPKERERRMRPNPHCFTTGLREGPCFPMFSNQKPRTLTAFAGNICPLLQVLAKQPMGPPEAWLSGMGDEFVQPTASSPS